MLGLPTKTWTLSSSKVIVIKNVVKQKSMVEVVWHNTEERTLPHSHCKLSAISGCFEDMQLPACWFFTALVSVVFPCRFLCSLSGDFKVLIWKNGPVIVGETTLFHAVVVLNSKPEVIRTLKTDKNVKCEFSWNVSSHSWIDRRTTDKCNSSFNWRWTEGGNETVFVSVGIFISNGRDVKQEEKEYKSYHVTNQTRVSVKEKQGEFWTLLWHKFSHAFVATLTTRGWRISSYCYNGGIILLSVREDLGFVSFQKVLVICWLCIYYFSNVTFSYFFITFIIALRILLTGKY